MTILEHFTKGLKQHEWDYYSNRDKQENQENLSLIENWNDAINHVNFIQEYLRISGKMEVIQNFEYSGLTLNSFPRAAHTNSAFFLGCVLYKELKLMSKINFTRKDGNDEFFFIVKKFITMKIC